MKLLLFIILISFTNCFTNQNNTSKGNKDTSRIKKTIVDRMNSKKILNDTVKFNDFAEYLLFIPSLKLPIEIKHSNDIHNPYWFTHRNFCNYGPYPCKPLAKVEKKGYVAIIYSSKTSGNELHIYSYMYNGLVIDSAEIFMWIGMGPVEENCLTIIDDHLNIQMDYSQIHFKSFDTKDTLEVIRKKCFIKFLDNGNIEMIKSESK